jgi:glycosyltransferase involved in cell wall biosynthesis
VVVADRLRQVPWKVLSLVRLIVHEKFDIVQNVMFTAGVIGTLVARACGVPIVINCIRSLGFLHYHYRRPIKRILYRMSDCVIANSKQTESLLIQRRLAHATKIHTIYNGVDTDRYQPPRDPESISEIKRVIGVGDHGPVVGMVANLSPVKNHDCLLKAIVLVLKEFPRSVFLLVGSGALKEGLERTAQSLGINASVFFWAKERTRPTYCARWICRSYVR